MIKEKKELISSIVPKAILRAKSEEAKASTFKSSIVEGIIGVWDFPFKVGRESRIKVLDNENFITTRPQISGATRNSDLYIIDINQKLQISREHIVITKEEDKYYLLDKVSTCGTSVNKEDVKHNTKVILNDGDIIQLGSSESPFVFEFIVFENEVI